MDSDTIQFGKYHGRSFKSVFEADPGYVKWVLNQNVPSGSSSNFGAFQSYARERFRNLDSNANICRTGCVSEIVDSWNFDSMIRSGLLPDLSFPKSPRISQRYGHPMIFGTFVGYLIRRMIHQINDEPISEPLMCEVSLAFLSKHDLELEYRVKIDIYKDLSKPWNTVLREIWDIAQIDQLYRQGIVFLTNDSSAIYDCQGKAIFDHVPIPNELLDPEYSLYRYMEVVANSFRGKTTRYNPDLGFGPIKADAHLIVDETLIQFKVVLDPAPTRDTAQCYCYKILADKHGIPIKKIEIYYLLHEVVMTPPILDLTTIAQQYLDFEDKN